MYYMLHDTTQNTIHNTIYMNIKKQTSKVFINFIYTPDTSVIKQKSVTND
jgi:hypothetical protein